jgi:hypothetical protein
MGRLAAWLVAGAALAAIARAERLFPGEYRGWVVKDRWDVAYLANGVYFVPLGDEAARQAKPSLGKPVDARVAELEDIVAGEQRITKFEALAAAEEPPLAIDVTAPARLTAGKSLHVHVRVVHRGKGAFEFRCRDLQVLLRAREPDDKAGEPLDAKDDEGTPWLRGGYGWGPVGPETVRAFRVWSAPGGTLEAKGAFTYEIDLNVELPPGEYELTAVHGDANLSKPPCAMSAAVPVDVR